MENWKFILGILLVFNLKNLPLMWHFRFFRALAAGMLIHRNAQPHFQPRHIFSPAVSATRSPLMECDFNLHKSNSTYFTDLDVSRAYLSGILFGPLFLKGMNGRRCNLIVGSVSCSFRREIGMYKAYETWTRIASWDDKWIYMVTHFVSSGAAALPPTILPFGADKGTKRDSQISRHMTTTHTTTATTERVILASAVTQFVCKQGRKTVQPTQALAASGLLGSPQLSYEQSPSSSSNNHGQQFGDWMEELERAIPADIEALRKANLPAVQLRSGWDKVHDLFESKVDVLGFHQ